MTSLNLATLIAKATKLMERHEYVDSEMAFYACLQVATDEKAMINEQLRKLRELVLADLGLDLPTSQSVAHSTRNIVEAVGVAKMSHTEPTGQAAASSVISEDDFDSKVFHPKSKLEHGPTGVRGGRGRWRGRKPDTVEQAADEDANIDFFGIKVAADEVDGLFPSLLSVNCFCDYIQRFPHSRRPRLLKKTLAAQNNLFRLFTEEELQMMLALL
ncbi:hypothetical protein HDE_10925 [Halotydeus destructor]|nr:hypothetical protein HDE_10925 [Halotydeus destructor]